jgi:hypothetical protein
MLYGRAMRHSNVPKCAKGSLAFYLAFCFSITHEFEYMTDKDWSNNESWFNIKLLVECFGNGDSLRKGLSQDSYLSAVTTTMLKELEIISKKQKHLGRNIGAKMLELIEEDLENIRRLGNWDPSMQQKCYSTKIPMSPIRKLAGYTTENGMHYNTRAVLVIASDELKRSTRIGCWCYDVYNLMDEKIMGGGNCWTAWHFVNFMCGLNETLLQDAAAMLILDPERSSHPFFQLACFGTTAFEVRVHIIFFV